jgi:hypothetical protein
VLTFLLKLNAALAEKEGRGEAIQAPGIPASITDPSSIISDDKLSP